MTVRAPWFLLLGALAACPPAPEAPTDSADDRCLDGDAAACHALADAHLAGEHPPPSRRRVDRFYEGVCGTGHDASACMAAALFARACDAGDGGACAEVADLVRDRRVDGPGPAGALYARACRAGHAPSCGRLGAPPSEATAATLREGCDGGAGAACFALGRAHATGQLELDQAEARRYFERGCAVGEGRACAALADVEVRGLGGAVKRRAGTVHYRAACTAGIAPACLTLARHVEHGELGLPADPAAAFDLYRRARSLSEAACAEKKASACGRLGVLLREGSGGPSETKRGRRLQAEACVAGDAESCRRAAIGPSGRFDLARVPEGAAGALREACATDGDACLFLAVIGEVDLEPSCARGHGPSCTAAGLAPVDATRLRRACDLGDANGCHHLALVKAHVEQELEPALDLFRDACRWGSGAACTQVGILRLRGEGMRLNPMAATSAFVQACRLGDATGCAELGWLRLSGQGKKDLEEGVAKLTGACRRGQAQACARLGMARLRGQHGLDRDPAAGKTLLREACARGSERGCLDLAEALDGKEPALVVEAARRGRRRCQEALLRCGETTAWTRVLHVTRDHLQPRVSPPPRCGGELERLCNDAAEATAAHCAAEASACWTAAVFSRRLTSMGTSVTTAEAQEKRAVAWARGACAKGEGAACAVLSEAYRAGRGVRQDDVAADRFLARACKADPGYCP